MMRKITEAEKKRMWAEVREEFPDDEMMQELHFVRLMHYLQTKDLSPAEQISFYHDSNISGRNNCRRKKAD